MKFLGKVIYLSVLLTVFIGCGSGEATNDKVETENKKEFITKDNFLNMAQYHYIKASSNLRISKKSKAKSSRSQYPGQKKDRVKNHQKDVLYVSTVAPFSQYIQKLNISYNNQKINLTISGDTANVIYFDGSKEYSKNLTLKEFSQTNQALQIKGE